MNFDLYLSIGLIIWLLIVTILYLKLSLHYRNLTKGVSSKNLLSSLNHLISQAKLNKEDLDKLDRKLESEINLAKLHLQKIGFQRYNPFTNTGGDQSFSLCLLDAKGNGVVISSLHSRETTRVYAKNVVKGKAAGVSLSVEEQEVIKNALQ